MEQLLRAVLWYGQACLAVGFTQMLVGILIARGEDPDEPEHGIFMTCAAWGTVTVVVGAALATVTTFTLRF